jgi:hypothetical protein
MIRPPAMRALFLLGCLFLLLPGSARATTDRDYLKIYVKLNDSERLERSGDLQGALQGFDAVYESLMMIRTANRDWDPVLVDSRLEDCSAKIIELRRHLQEQGNAGLPPDFDTAPAESTHAYPWKSGIVTTVFWIGEGSTASGWDPHWVRDNGGADDQYDMSGYAAAHHASTLNPFYAALPFNDLAHPKLAAKWLPRGWSKAAMNGKSVSACKGRWIEIKARTGRVCFAQWEDVGPIVTDDAGYVFGPDRPAATRGLNLSPAAARYLGFDSAAILSWRFVDDDDVIPGLWLRYDEQAVLFRAMHEEETAH